MCKEFRQSRTSAGLAVTAAADISVGQMQFALTSNRRVKSASLCKLLDCNFNDRIET